MVGTHPEKSRKGLFQYDRCTLTVSAHPEKSRKGLFQYDRCTLTQSVHTQRRGGEAGFSMTGIYYMVSTHPNKPYGFCGR